MEKKMYLILAVIVLLLVVNGIVCVTKCGSENAVENITEQESQPTVQTQPTAMPTLPQQTQPAVSESEVPAEPEVTGWYGFQKATTLTDIVVYSDEAMTQPSDITVPSGETVIICRNTGDRCMIRRGTSIGWTSADSLTAQGEPTVYQLSSTAAEPASLAGTELASRLDKTAAQHECVGVQMAVITDGQISWLYEYGYSDQKSKTPMTSDVKLRAASVSKVIVGMGIMSMHDMGTVDIDTDVSTYWGAPVVNPNFSHIPITFRNIMTHTSSLKDFGYKKRPTSALASGLLQYTSYMYAEPGSIEAYEYNNSAICAAGAIAGKAADCNFDKYVREYFFAPMGIDASFHAKNIRQTELIAPTYNDGKTTMTVDDLLNIKYFGGAADDYSLYAGGLTISAKDLARMVCILMGGGQYEGMYYLSPQSVEQMLIPGHTIEDYQQCLVLRYKEDLLGGRKLYYHNGNLMGVYSLLCFDPDSGNGLVVISNGSVEPKLQNGVYTVCGDLAAIAAELWN